LRLKGLDAPAAEGIAVLDTGVEELTLGHRALKFLMNFRLDTDIGVGLAGFEESDVEFTICA
jgi:hypothetical protein